MNAVIEQVLEEIRGAWRFRWYAIGLAWSVCVIGWLVVLLMPDRYAASARVFVDMHTTLSQVTQGIAIESNAETQIQRVRQTLLGAPQLTTVARETSLDPGSLTDKARQSLVNTMRERIEINASSPGGSAGVYAISYTDTDRDRSLRVVSRLVNTFVEGALAGKRAGSEQAQKFLVDQIADYEKRLASDEERLAAFKKENVGLMPGAQGDYFSRLQSDMEDLSKVKASLAIALRKREAIEAQLHGEQPFVNTASSTNSPALSRGVAVGTSSLLPGLTETETAARLREAQSRLDELLLRFTDKHPDVIALRQTIADLRERQREEIAAARHGDSGAAAQLGMSPNPVFQSIELQRNQINVEIAALQAEIADRSASIESLRKLVNTAPEVEAEFARLNRDYGVTKAQYQALVERLQHAKLGEEAEASGVMKFEVMEPPTAAFTPVAPHRPALIAFVLVIGLGGGAALAYLLHQLKPVFHTARQLAAITGLPVIGTVSMTWLEAHRSLARRGAVAFAGTTILLVVTTGLVVGIQGRAASFLHQLVS